MKQPSAKCKGTGIGSRLRLSSYIIRTKETTAQKQKEKNVSGANGGQEMAEKAEQEQSGKEAERQECYSV
jgi:hypothetical protein